MQALLVPRYLLTTRLATNCCQRRYEEYTGEYTRWLQVLPWPERLTCINLQDGPLQGLKELIQNERLLYLCSEPPV